MSKVPFKDETYLPQSPNDVRFSDEADLEVCERAGAATMIGIRLRASYKDAKHAASSAYRSEREDDFARERR